LVFTLRQIAYKIGGEVIGDDQAVITGIAPLHTATNGDVSFFWDPRYKEDVKATNAAALIVSKTLDFFQGPQIIVPNPALAYARVAGLFAPSFSKYSGLSPKAFIHESSEIGENVSIYPMVYIGEEVVIGDNVTLFPGVFLGNGVKIGHDTLIYPNVTILHGCIIGNEVIIHAGSVIGSDGFGFVRDGSVNIKIPQIGIVQIDDRVEIGANNTIDRASMGKTWIKSGVKTDNLVQVAHNVVIGEDTIIVAQTALGGSVQIGKGVIIGGQVAVSDHVKIEDRAMIGSQSGVPKTISKGQIVSGTPAMPHRLWLKTRGLITRLPETMERLRGLEKQVNDLESLLKKMKNR
jgi:UDP-3-O-[3-hydroxymyristoyl] glucosamine N-acyltransferase